MGFGSGSQQAAPNLYQFQNDPGADTGAFSGTQNLPGSVANTGFNPASTVTAGNNVTAATQNAGLPGYATQALQTGFDPQQALYAQNYQQMIDQANVTNAQNGVAGTPYGAGVVGQDATNFNLDWQNQALQRQQTGASTAEGLLGQYGSGTQTGTGISQAGGQFAQNLSQQQIADFLSYLQGSNQAQGNAVSDYSAGVGAQQNVNNSSAGLGSLIGLGASFLF